MTDLTQTRWLPIVLLVLSNVFMTVAWYGHLNFKQKPLWVVVLVSWGIAFIEYWLAVPANRWGSNSYTPAQLKIIQEVVTLIVFSFFSIYVLHSPIKWNHIAAFGCILMAVGFIVIPKS